uniref:hypothetical protein n=1 Tax=uncultured Caulobacter sp. TaxID=158749 RepID=UPI0025DA4D0D|nr:hypothetical protein [uncultured Caulobacter sp.]
MIDAKISFAQIEVAPAVRGKRLPPLVGLGLGAMVSIGLWAGLALTVSHLF